MAGLGRMRSMTKATDDTDAGGANGWATRTRVTPTVLAQILERDIRSGRYRVGDRLPTELELQDRYGASRYCVREALQQLKRTGMVSARAGIGHAVTASQPHETDRFMRSAITLPELVQSSNTRLRLLAVETLRVDRELAVRAGFAQGSEVVHVRALRMKTTPALPTALLSIYLPPAHAGVVDSIDEQTEAFHVMIERLCRVTIQEVRQRIVATTADAASAGPLQARLGEPCLEIDRQFLDSKGQIIFASLGLYPSDRFSHDTAFQVMR